MVRNMVSIKIGMVGKNVGFSGTHRTSYTQKNLNVYPHQSRITFHTMLWDTLYSRNCSLHNRSASQHLDTLKSKKVLNPLMYILYLKAMACTLVQHWIVRTFLAKVSPEKEVEGKAQYFYSFKASYDSQMFCFTTRVIKTKYLRSLIQGIVQGFEWVEILGFRLRAAFSCFLKKILQLLKSHDHL